MLSHEYLLHFGRHSWSSESSPCEEAGVKGNSKVNEDLAHLDAAVDQYVGIVLVKLLQSLRDDGCKALDNDVVTLQFICAPI